MARLFWALFFNVYFLGSLWLFYATFLIDEYWVRAVFTLPLSAGLALAGLGIWDARKGIAKLEEADSTPKIRK